MSQVSDPVAVLIGDVHLSDKPPIFRSTEDDWYAAQLRPLEQVYSTAQKYECPVLIAGDLFDSWRASSKLVSWFLSFLNDHQVMTFAIPGQHDMPNHSLADLDRSAYGVLSVSGCPFFHDLSGFRKGPRSQWIENTVIYGFPWGADLMSRTAFYEHYKGKHVMNNGKVHIALLHQFVWHPKDTTLHANLTDHSLNAHSVIDIMTGFDIIGVGDHHKAFDFRGLWNCGNLIRRKSDESKQQHYYVIGIDNSVKKVQLANGDDRYADIESSPDLVESTNLEQFLGSLRDLAQDDDLQAALKQLMSQHKVRKAVRELLSNVMD